MDIDRAAYVIGALIDAFFGYASHDRAQSETCVVAVVVRFTIGRLSVTVQSRATRAQRIENTCAQHRPALVRQFVASFRLVCVQRVCVRELVRAHTERTREHAAAAAAIVHTRPPQSARFGRTVDSGTSSSLDRLAAASEFTAAGSGRIQSVRPSVRPSRLSQHTLGS